MEHCHGGEAAEKHLGAAGRRYTRSQWHGRLGASCGHDEHHLGHPFTIHSQLLVPLDNDMDEGHAVQSTRTCAASDQQRHVQSVTCYLHGQLHHDSTVISQLLHVAERPPREATSHVDGRAVTFSLCMRMINVHGRSVACNAEAELAKTHITSLHTTLAKRVAVLSKLQNSLISQNHGILHQWDKILQFFNTLFFAVLCYQTQPNCF